jgi:cytochrome c oxidase subunit II
MISVLYVPARRPIKLIMTSRDVIHSFYVPEFRIKQDVIPGRYTTVWFEAREPGAYPILCTEYCGTSHSGMRGNVIALDAADYEHWLAGGLAKAPEPAREATAAAEGFDMGRDSASAGPFNVGRDSASAGPFTAPEPTLPRRGEHAAAEQGCLRCHTLDGTPHLGPTWAGLYRSVVPLASGEEVVADEAYITESMMDPLAKNHRGFPPIMPSYLGRITPPDVAAMIELMKSLRDVPRRGPVVPENPNTSGRGDVAPEGTMR